MDGENKGKPYCLMDDLGGFPPIFGNTHIYIRRNPLLVRSFFPNRVAASLTSSEVHGADLNLLTEGPIASQGENTVGGMIQWWHHGTNNHGLPSRELTYPTLREKENHFQKCDW